MTAEPQGPAEAIYNQASQIANAIPQWERSGDDWFNVSDDWDMNLFVNDDGLWEAVLYPVVLGNTQVQGYCWSVPIQLVLQ